VSQESLGGNARTSLVVAVAEAMEHSDETLQSLQFGTRAMFVENSVRLQMKGRLVIWLAPHLSLPGVDRSDAC